jgi:hypothetical protein
MIPPESEVAGDPSAWLSTSSWLVARKSGIAAARNSGMGLETLHFVPATGGVSVQEIEKLEIGASKKCDTLWGCPSFVFNDLSLKLLGMV